MFKKKVQVSLEIAVALILLLILIVGSIKLYTWTNSRLVLRQKHYEETRVTAGDNYYWNAQNDWYYNRDETSLPNLDIVGESQ